MTELKKIVSFSLDENVNNFIEKKHWEYKMSKSSFLNIILNNLIKKEYADLLHSFFANVEPRGEPMEDEIEFFKI